MSQIETIMSSKGAMIGLAIVAFLVAAILVLVIVRMLFGGRLRMPGGRARQARLGIVDAFDLDRQRQLIIIRRDNTEHLILIGGPNDLLIESEIVRFEARESRDQRRDKDLAFSVDGRIPAPHPADARGLEPRSPVDEPLLPMPLPEVPAVVTPEPVAEATPQRAPTFPLPARRPPPAPERRPPLLPEGVSRGDAGPVIVDSIVPTPGPSVPPPSGPAAPPLTAPPRTLPPPFLKPLPPRAPLRPLQRTTPVVPPPAGTALPVAPPPAKPVAPAPVKPPPPKQAVPTPVTESADALESLEEEMAKLLGRGPG